MATAIASDWTYEVNRGPDCLFVKLKLPRHGDVQGAPLAAQLWEMMEQHFARRLVLEFEGLDILRSYVIGQLVQLHKRIHTRGGLLRLVGLSDNNYEALRACRLHDHFPCYKTREDAVMGHRPPQPR